MSAWPQAVWIVRRLEDKISFQINVDAYTEKLNTLNGRVNQLNTRVSQAQMKSITIIAEDDNNNPNHPKDIQSSSYGENAIWLII